jgi:CO dehydrogenase nickel-insertion accessory protein CooC1
MVENRTLIDTRIGVFGKGGSGKSTFVVLLAQSLRKRAYNVYVLDADSTNIGLAQALGIEQAPVPLLDYFGGMVFSGGLVTCPVDDPTPLTNAQIRLNDLPTRYYARNQDGITLLTAGKIAGRGPGAGCDGPVAKIARDFCIQDQERAVTLVDFKAGFEDTARGAITSLDWAVVVVDPTTASVELAADMRDTVDEIIADELPATRHLESPELVTIANELFIHAALKGVFFVLNKIPNDEVASYLTDKLAERGLTPIGIIHEDASIALSWLQGLPVESEQAEEDVGKVIAKLEAVEEAHAS